MQINSAEEHQRAVGELQRLESAAKGSPQEKRRASLLAAIQDYERRVEGRNLGKGRPAIDKRRAGGRRS